METKLYPAVVTAEPRTLGLPLELAVIIPTYNESENISPLIEALKKALAGIEWEAIFVDDNSPDGTAELIRQLSATDRRIRVLERIGRRGLSSACIEGMLATAAPYIAVMDADLQHDEAILPTMLNRIKSGCLDIVIASRSMPGGSMGEFARERVWLSKFGTHAARIVCRSEISDAMSGFFLMDRAFFQRVASDLTGTGFKILLDLLSSSSCPVRVAEVPYRFRNRQRGTSKLDVRSEFDYLHLLVAKVAGERIPSRLFLSVLIGSLGLCVHLGSFTLLHFWARFDFVIAQTAATFVAMTFNFLLRNAVAFRDRRLHGWRLASRLLMFYLGCSVGVLINVRLAESLYTVGMPWYLAGISGMVVSSIWNYGVIVAMAWRRNRVFTVS